MKTEEIKILLMVVMGSACQGAWQSSVSTHIHRPMHTEWSNYRLLGNVQSLEQNILTANKAESHTLLFEVQISTVFLKMAVGIENLKVSPVFDPWFQIKEFILRKSETQNKQSGILRDRYFKRLLSWECAKDFNVCGET